MRTWKVEEFFLSVFSFQLRWRCEYVRKHRGKWGGKEEEKNNRHQTILSWGQRNEIPCIFLCSVRNTRHVNVSVFRCNAIWQWWTSINRANRTKTMAYIPIFWNYVHCIMYIQRIGNILLAIKCTHDIMTQPRMKTTQKTMRISVLNIFALVSLVSRLSFCFSLSFDRVHFTLFIGIRRWPTVKKNDRINVRDLNCVFCFFFSSSSWFGLYHR